MRTPSDQARARLTGGNQCALAYRKTGRALFIRLIRRRPADDKACIVGHDALLSAVVCGHDGLRGRGQSIVLCTHRNPHWRHDGLVVQALAASLFEGASSCSHKRQRLRKATSTTTRRSASELGMHSVKRHEPAQRKVNRDRRQGINQSDRHHIVPWRLVAVEELIDSRRHGHIARR